MKVSRELAEPASDAARPGDVEAYAEAVREYPGLVGAGYANALGWPIGRVSRVHDEAKTLGLVVTRQVNGTWITYAPEETDG